MDKGSGDERIFLEPIDREPSRKGAQRKTSAPDYGQRQAGMRPGTYIVTCDWCKGSGMPTFLPSEMLDAKCIKCDGSGVITINGERHGDAAARRTAAHRHRENNMVIGAIGLILLVTAALLTWAALTNRLPWY